MRIWLVVTLIAGISGACADPAAPVSSNTTPGKLRPISIKAIPVVPPRPIGDFSRLDRNAIGDLDAIVARGYLRVLVAASRTHFENKSSAVRGRAVDVGVALEALLNQQAAPATTKVVFLETAEDALIADLLAGKGDVAANLLLTFERDDQVAFAKPLKTGIRELVVNGAKEPHVVSLEDVGGRSIHVRTGSDHHASVIRLNEQLKKIDRPQARIVAAPRSRTDEDLLDMVNAGKIPATLAYDYIYDQCCERLEGLKTNRNVAVSQDGTLAWITRKDAPKLLAFLNEFFSTHSLATGVP